MKTCGYVFTVLGVLSFLGAALMGHSVSGPLFWLGLGVYLIHRAGQKKKEKEDKDKWAKGE